MNSPIKDALEQVRTLQQAVLDHQRFHGYSGVARIVSGFAALGTAVLMSLHRYPATVRAHLLGWACVFLFALLVNGSAILYWFMNDKRVHRDIRRLRPLLDAIAPLLVGGVFTAALILAGNSSLLFGVWMSMFGLSNLASRHVLPWWMGFVGIFYIASGAAWLLAPGTGLINPWPMGLVFFAGELAGGIILHFDSERNLTSRRPHAGEADHE